MVKRRKRRKNLSIKIVIPAIATLIIVILFAIGMSKDSETFSSHEGQMALNPYIELSELDGEQYLVGDVVVEWLKGDVSGKELYHNFVSRGKVYTAKPVTIRYTIYDLPHYVNITGQRVELSDDESMKDAKCFDLASDKRSITFEHLFTGRTYYYRVTVFLSDGNVLSVNSQFVTADTPRLISTEGVWNMRDIGGVKTLDGLTLKQGMVYRGVELDGAVNQRYAVTSEGARVLTEELGIRTELDLRGEESNMQDALGPNVMHKVYPAVYAYSDSLDAVCDESYRQLFSDLAKEENYPIYIHCTYGKDRTGTVVFLLQMLLGVSEETAYREWELSVLLDGDVGYEIMEDYINDLYEFEGDTLQEKVENHLLAIGVTKAEIESIREILIENYASEEAE